ncbi:MAG: hypothetical protein EZS28_020202 [Streblomastix strix]|uniref:Uncharacterized protein n=1 Tax=Streblomastix strix TaxID=222440 RepID=A0A5J4VPQ9_9EUKA|nr:MAG: hypothetical protein EZS28_020202 [Streblomastix strix]
MPCNKANSGVSYTKGEDDALLLLKADKTQLIDSYTKTDTDNLLNNKANTGVSYTKGEDDMNCQEKKADTTELSNQITLDTSQTITANKTFNNACRFVSSIDRISTITGSSFVKSCTDDIVVLLGAGRTKQISELSSSVDDSNYVKKTGQSTQSIKGNLIRSYAKYKSVQNERQYVQEFQGKLRIKQDDDEFQGGNFLKKEELNNKYVTLGGTQTITGAKTFTISVTAQTFVKYSGKNQQVLLADGTIKPISEFITTIDNQNYVKNDGDVQDIQGILRKVTLDQPYLEPTNDDYMTLGAMKSEFVSSIYSSSISSNLTANQFIQSDKDDTSVLLADGGDM